MIGHPISRGKYLPGYIVGNYGLDALENDKNTGKPYQDNLCFFRCLALHNGCHTKNLERDTKYYCLLFNDKRETCLRDGKTLKVVLCTKFCPACDKQVIASVLVQLRINFTCIFKVFQFCENFENTREINL